ncbi:MAG: bifunctional riboflavin kinase/FAD synthetase [Anaerolineae bacterium]|jgi:riboflavin kinase/FMN adenylyltransferase|nr:bifunctional riboflavin kinase/FAD synthetase [Anaerolineae bacterium]
MWIEHGIAHLKLRSPHATTIGAFDGVHLGHRTLIETMVASARAHDMGSLVVTFDPLPGQLRDPHRYQLLSTLSERLERLQDLGIEGAIVVPFDTEFMQTTALDFTTMLAHHLALRALWVGPDFRLGRGREGDVDYLRQAGSRLGFEIEVLEHTVTWADLPVRSSRIREALRSGDIMVANACLGYPYRLTGTVGHGEHRGRLLGFPTANLDLPEGRLLPANGVYVCHAHMDAATYSAITNVGTRPTFDHHPPNVEAHLLDFAGSIYGRTVRLDFLKRLRPELRFESADALICQMHQDEAAARAWLAGQCSGALGRGC